MVKRHQRRTKSGKIATVREHKRKHIPAKVAGFSVAALAGLTPVAFLLNKKRLQSTFKKFGKENLAKTSDTVANQLRTTGLKPADIKRGYLTISVPGMAMKEKSTSAGFTRYLQSDLRGHIHEFVHTDKKQGFLPNIKHLVKNTAKARSKEAEELASLALGYQKAFPGMKVNLIGHSYGGTVVNDALYILNNSAENTDNIRAVTFGASTFGMLPSQEKNALHIVDVNDAQSKLFGSSKQNLRKPTKLDESIPFYMRGHSSYHYWSNYKNEVKKFAKDVPQPPKRQKQKKKKV